MKKACSKGYGYKGKESDRDIGYHGESGTEPPIFPKHRILISTVLVSGSLSCRWVARCHDLRKVFVSYVELAIIESVLECSIVYDDDEYENDENECF